VGEPVIRFTGSLARQPVHRVPGSPAPRSLRNKFYIALAISGDWMPGPDRDDAPQQVPQSKVVKKVKKVKKASTTPASGPETTPAVEPFSDQGPSATPASPAFAADGSGPTALRPDVAAPASQASISSPPATPPPPPLPPPPPGYVSGDHARATPPVRGDEERPSVESRISAIDINKLTDELEKDILSSLHKEITGLMTPPPPVADKTVLPPPPGPAARAPAAPEPAGASASHPSKTLAQTRAIESDQRERRVAHRLGKEFDKLPVNMRNELIKTLARTDDYKVREDVVIAVASNFGKLPLEVQSLLKALAADQDSRVREEVAFELNRNFKNIPQDVRSELLEMLARDVDITVREDVVAAITGHYSEDADRMRALLRALASDRKGSVRDQVTAEMARNSEQIPEETRAELQRIMERTAAEESRGKE
jgi:hypothetical protein